VWVKLGARGLEQIAQIERTSDEDAALKKSAAAAKVLTVVIGVCDACRESFSVRVPSAHSRIVKCLPRHTSCNSSDRGTFTRSRIRSRPSIGSILDTRSRFAQLH
jgi:hypothetical protein